MSSLASSDDGSRSSRSSFSEGGGSVISDNSNAGALAALGDREDDDNVQDLLDQNKGVWDAAFSCLLLLTKRRSVTSYRMLLARMVFEYLQVFRLVFNTRFLWAINTDLWVWKAMYWVLFRFLIWDMGYATYVKGLYGVCAIVLLLVVLTVLIAVVLRKDDSTNWWFAKLIRFVQSVSVLVFSVAWIAVFDYMVFMFTCHWGTTNTHLKWTSVECIAMPHLGSMVFGGATAVIFAVFVVCLAMADCKGDMLTRNLMASPVVMTVFKTTVLKLIMVVVSTCLDEFPKPQAVLMFICPVLSTYFQASSSPYLLPWMNHAWTGLWATIVYTTSLLLVLNFNKANQHGALSLATRQQMTMAVLWGIIPALLVGAAVSWLTFKWRTRPLQALKKARQDVMSGRLCLDSAAALKSLFRPSSVDQVEFLVRCVRQFDPVTEEVLPEAVALAGLVIQVGMAKFPNHPAILMLYANYIIFVKKEPRSARTQLQLAAKNEPGVVERFMIFAALDVLKSSHSDADSGLDLMAFVEFQRNYRACVKSHKTALMAQRAFWRAVMNDKLHMADLLASLKNMQTAELRAIYVYKRVLERYPQNGKLLKVWGRFQEWVLHDPGRAARTYAEAIKRGLGDNMLNLAGEKDNEDDNDDNQKSRKIDDKTDGVIIIDAKGVILLANKTASKMFRYFSGELEGKNVSILMPQPFSGRHNRYLSNHVSTGVAKILDSDRHVVALRKDHTIFPLNLFVRKLSGSGTESIFIAILRQAQEDDPNLARVWTSPTGMILCSDVRFCDWFGVTAENLSNRTFSSLAVNPEFVDKFLNDCNQVSMAEAEKGNLCLKTCLHHKYLQEMEVEMTVVFGGTETERIMVINMRSVTDAQRMMVVDSSSRILYVTTSFAQMLGMHVASLYKANLSCIIPQPLGHLHKPWVKDAVTGSHIRAGSCRSAGAVVQVLAGNGQRVPVRLDVKTVQNSHSEKVDHHHIIKFTKATADELADARRMRLVVNQQGTVLEAPGIHPKNMFGFDAQSLVGRPLASFINLFEEFRVQQATEQASSGSVNKLNRGPEFSKVALQLQLDAVGEGVDLTPAMLGAGSDDRRGIDASSLDDSVLLALLVQAAQEGSTASYRVGVLAQPLLDQQIGKPRLSSGSGSNGTSSPAHTTTGPTGMKRALSKLLLSAMGSKAATLVRPAILKVDTLDEESGGSSDGDVRILVELWRADLLSGVLEVNSDLKVVRADAAAGQLLGCSGSMLNQKQLKRVLVLPKDIETATDFMRTIQTKAQTKASALKKTSKPVNTSGPVIKATGIHADTEPVELLLQAVPKDAHTTSRLLLNMTCSKPATTGSLQAMLRLAGAANTSAAGALPSLAGGKLLDHQGSKSCKLPVPMADPMLGATMAGPKSGAGLLRESVGGQIDKEQMLTDAPGGVEEAAAEILARPAAKGKGSRSTRGNRLESDRSKQAGREGEEEAAATAAPRKKGGYRAAAGYAGDGDDAEYMAGAAPGGWGMAKGRQVTATGKLEGYEQGDWGQQADGTVYNSGSGAYLKGQGLKAGQRLDLPGDEADAADKGGALGMQYQSTEGSDGAPADGNAGSDVGSDEDADRHDVASIQEEHEEEEDLTCDWRRAKRLRNLVRQLDSPLARKALTYFWNCSWLLAGVIAIAHIVGFAVLALGVKTRHTDVYGVQQMTYAVDKSQMLLLRSNMLSKCGYLEFQDEPLCSKEQKQLYLHKQISNTADMHYYHKGLFLGFKDQKVDHMPDQVLFDYWMLPVHTETAYLDTSPPSLQQQNISLWNLGNRYIYAAREAAYAYTSGVTGVDFEADRSWQYVDRNGKDSLFKGYSISLDIYVSFVWSELGSLGALLTGILVAEYVAVAIGLMMFQMSVIRQMARQRMACFSVFLALPTATLRAMATLPCQVDEDEVNDEDEDELAEAAAAAAGAVSTEAGTAAAGAASSADAARKSVRMSITGDSAPKSGGKDAKLGKLGKKKGKGKNDEQEMQGWFSSKRKAAKHALHGMMNHTLKVNGKRLYPSRGVFARFMVPLLLWWLLGFAMFGVSFKELADLQAPLTSLQAAAKVQYLIARTRVLANMIGFLPDQTDTTERIQLKQMLNTDLQSLRSTYFTLLYGGVMESLEPGAGDIIAPAAIFHSIKTANLFFKTTSCLRLSQPCVQKGSPWYDVTHSGLDAMVQRFISDMEEFINLPAATQTVNASCYQFTWRIGAIDLYEGLQTAGDLFVLTTLNALSQLSMMHAILLALTIAILAVQVFLLLVPFRKQLLQESMRLAGLLSLLPQECDAEGHVRALVLDVARGKQHDGQRGWGLAKGVTAAAAAARAAAARASGAMSNMRSRMAEAAATGASNAAAAGWQPYEEQAGSEASSAQDW